MRCAFRTLARTIFALAFVSIATPSLAGFGSSVMPTGKAAVPPAGVTGFCMRHMDECGKQAQGSVIVELTGAKQRELDEVQANINAAIQPVEDPNHVWEYPVNGQGDCNKFALAKRRELIAKGWPREALLLTVAMTEHGEAHLVLVVTTSEGTLVLDNRLQQVVDWRRLPYRWVEQQSPVQLTSWVSIQ